MLCATKPVVLFEHLRVPYRVAAFQGLPRETAAVWADGREEHALIWPCGGRLTGWGTFAGAPVRTAGPVVDAELVAAVPDTSRILQFDPNDAIESLWSEAYRTAGRSSGLRRVVLDAYYVLRPILPRAAQIRMRQVFARVQRRTSFPRWPFEPALHDLCDSLLGYVVDAAGEPVPYLEAWPDEHRWALVLTHDVEHLAGCARIPRMAALERVAGYRSSWNFVPKRYEVDKKLVAQLQSGGFEIGVHGLYHDGRDLHRAFFDERAPQMQAAARDWHAIGFRSPATHRDWDLMPELGFDYDSSYPDTDPYEPQPGGCCSLLPFFNRDLVELPITLPQDHTLFTILRERGAATWIGKAETIRQRGGMALLITHPDYMDDSALAAYGDFLERFADEPEVWRALPRDVSAWWRRRAATTLEPTATGWRAVGPAEGEARITFASS